MIIEWCKLGLAGDKYNLLNGVVIDSPSTDLTDCLLHSFHVEAWNLLDRSATSGKLMIEKPDVHSQQHQPSGTKNDSNVNIFKYTNLKNLKCSIGHIFHGFQLSEAGRTWE